MFWSISNFDWRQQCRRETTADNLQQDPVSLNGRHPGRSVHGEEALDLASGWLPLRTLVGWTSAISDAEPGAPSSATTIRDWLGAPLG